MYSSPWRSSERDRRISEQQLDLDALDPISDSEAIRCGACGYSLTGLAAGGQCPECGELILESIYKAARSWMEPRAARSLAWRLNTVAVLQVSSVFGLAMFFISATNWFAIAVASANRALWQFLLLPSLFLLIRFVYIGVAWRLGEVLAPRQRSEMKLVAGGRGVLAIALSALFVSSWATNRDPSIIANVDYIVYLVIFPLLFASGLVEAKYHVLAIERLIGKTHSWQFAACVAGYSFASCGWLIGLGLLMCPFSLVAMVAPMGGILLGATNWSLGTRLFATADFAKSRASAV